MKYLITILFALTACGGEEESPCPFTPGTYRLTGTIASNSCNSSSTYDPASIYQEAISQNWFGAPCTGMATVSDQGCRVDYHGSCPAQGSVPSYTVNGFSEWVTATQHQGTQSATFSEVPGIADACTIEVDLTATRL